jgi:3-hydroxyisobutyrate dehydrogenase
MSTNSRDTNLRIHERQSAAGIAMLEAPVSGGVAAAKAGSLAIWVGGDEQVFRRCEPILRILGGERVRLVGPFGAGMVTKLAHNCAIGAISVALAEIFAMATRAGADPVALWAAVRQGALGRRRTFDALGNHFLTGTFEPTGAPLRIVYKDMLLATQLARDVGAPMRSANLALADFQEAMLRGWGERDYSCAMALSLQRTNTAICGNRDEIETVLRNDPPN